MDIFVNGVLTRKSTDWTADPVDSSIVFTEPLNQGDQIHIADLFTGNYYSYVAYSGQQRLSVGVVKSDVNTARLLDRAYEHRNHPLVRDCLDRLTVTLALVDNE